MSRAALWPAAAAAALVALIVAVPKAQPRDFPKKVLAWADVRNGYQHDSITHALATIERLGDESGLWETTIRTDSQPITKQPIQFETGTGIATGEQFLARNLTYYDAIFFFGVREAGLTDQQKADLLSFVRDDGKGFVATTPAAPRSSRGPSSVRCSADVSTSIRGASPTPPSSSKTARRR